MKLTHTRLREVLEYDSVTGEFRWKASPNRRIKVGSVAGCLRSDGYLSIRVDAEQFLAHRLAWFWATGVWPSNEIDHKNRIRTDNRLLNLREATRSENLQNARKSWSSSGIRGVSWCAREKRFRAYIKLNGKTKCLGYYNSLQEAEHAYLAAKTEMHPFFNQEPCNAS